MDDFTHVYFLFEHAWAMGGSTSTRFRPVVLPRQPGCSESLSAHASILGILLLDQSTDCLGLFLLHQHLTQQSCPFSALRRVEGRLPKDLAVRMHNSWLRPNPSKTKEVPNRPQKDAHFDPRVMPNSTPVSHAAAKPWSIPVPNHDQWRLSGHHCGTFQNRFSHRSSLGGPPHRLLSHQ